MKVSPISLAKLNPAISLPALVTARIKGTKAIITPIF
jgi:glycerol uptake facilitator-like aquaporin